jgi:hypothetical protein
MISFALEVDSATFQLFFMDLLDDLKLLSKAQAMAITLPSRWIADYNCAVLSPTSRSKTLDNVYQTKITAQKSKLYFQKLVIHPIKMTLTFTQTVFPRRYCIQ